ncbi:Quinone oxidoreductase 1 [Methylobacterium crusticola]|uniref:Quinone oxidoreductase 1 n=1 Tax=Methylobacterium crusticola TaxID=1697972 RepID=A0ABQ4R2J0_9HYPH|nr:quinone oxidoreductase [Methylobacterium crusticola]GJD51175.1 Quinone oxidoreductase 1 [Methylobacterium crusticola]
MTKAVRLDAFGGPEVMGLADVDLPEPGPGEARLRQTAIGFNYIDVYQRSGTYPLPLPTGLGHEAAGVVEAVGPGVTQVRAEDRAATMNAGLGAYATARNVAADRLVPIPAGIDDATAATVLFKGLTAQYLLRKTHAVQPGDLILVHAAAGGVGQILARWGKALGAEVLGTAGGPEKCAAARAAGCDIAVDYTRPDWVAALLEATGGRKARVVYDSVGRDTFLHSLDCAAPHGLVVVYGGASGPAPAIAPELLGRKGNLFLTRPSVFPHNADAAALRANAAELFEAVARGTVTVPIGARFPLAEIAAAHRAAEARATTGAILIEP